MKITKLLMSVMTLLLLSPLATRAGVWDTQYKQVEQNIKAPTFANREFLITKYGAKVSASAAINQRAINKAITACSKAGGGKVIVPAGVWNTGAIRLKSNVNLVVEEGATLLFAFEPKLYPMVKTRWEGMDCINYSPLIYAYGCKNIALTGKGTIDGNGTNDTWWKWNGAQRFGCKPGMPSQRTTGRPKLQKWNDDKMPIEKRVAGDGNYLRPQLVNFNNCENILIEDVTLLRSPFWVLHPLKSKNITVKDVHIYNDGPNGDGCDPEACDGVLIEGCYFHTGDDCIAIKSGRNNDGMIDGTPSQNIIVRNCEMADGHGGVVIGSEISGGCKNVFVENCKMDSPNLERVIRIKTNPCRGGVTENVFVRNVECGECKEAVLKINLDYEPNEPSPRLYNPTVKNVYLENVTCKKSEYGVYFVGLKNSTNIYNIKVKDCRFDGVTTNSNYLTGKVKDIFFDNYYLNGSLQLVNAPYKNYSQWMTASEMKRVNHPYLLDFSKKPKWSYVMGIELEAMYDTYKAYGDKAILSYLAEYPEKMIDRKGNITGYNIKDYNLDNIRTGRFIYRINQELPREGNAKAIKTLFKQLQNQPRTNQGVWFHKQIYHDQVWLDGIYMGQPFYTMSAPELLKNQKKVNKVYDDAVDQILSTAEKTFDAKTGLWRHAWDESHSLFWADKTTGQSAHTWGRAQGWFIMAITEVLDVLPENYARRGELVDLLQKVAKATVKYQDKKTGLWYDVMDVPNRKGNYFEATCSSMFAYALLKGARLGNLDESMKQAGIKAYNGIIKNFIKVNADSTISLTKCVSVSGLGPESNPRRDGSFEYYISEPIRDNDAKGVGPFIWASLEMEKLGLPINRKALLSRNNPVVESFNSLSSLSVGNGMFAATVDATGLQSYPDFF
jgi:polygalacturonase/rhamnogalacturonyl hydrolase YesR